jgi:hypothetical protein
MGIFWIQFLQDATIAFLCFSLLRKTKLLSILSSIPVIEAANHVVLEAADAIIIKLILAPTPALHPANTHLLAV